MEGRPWGNKPCRKWSRNWGGKLLRVQFPTASWRLREHCNLRLKAPASSDVRRYLWLPWQYWFKGDRGGYEPPSQNFLVDPLHGSFRRCLCVVPSFYSVLFFIFFFFISFFFSRDRVRQREREVVIYRGYFTFLLLFYFIPFEIGIKLEVAVC